MIKGASLVASYSAFAAGGGGGAAALVAAGASSAAAAAGTAVLSAPISASAVAAPSAASSLASSIAYSFGIGAPNAAVIAAATCGATEYARERSAPQSFQRFNNDLLYDGDDYLLENGSHQMAEPDLAVEPTFPIVEGPDDRLVLFGSTGTNIGSNARRLGESFENQRRQNEGPHRNEGFHRGPELTQDQLDFLELINKLREIDSALHELGAAMIIGRFYFGRGLIHLL